MEPLNGDVGSSAKKRSKFGAKSVKKPSIDAATSASSLVGSVVEKGISVNKPPTPAPVPTVVPFPVARHRSHGPHWAPPSTENTGDSDDDADDEDVMKFDKVAAFAKPVRKKEKKGMNFSRWREQLANEDTSTSHIKSEGKHLYMGARDQKKTSVGTVENLEEVRSLTLTSDVIMKEKDHAVSEEVASNVSAEASDASMGEMEVDISETLNGHKQANGEKHTISMHKSSTKPKEESISLQSQIDVENRARLESMSADEIADAQAEILGRINPALIAALKKRGQNKLNIHKDSSSNMAGNRKIQDPNKIVGNGNGHSPSNGDNPLKIKNEATKGTKSEQKMNLVQNLSSGRGSLWNSWSTRVEAARGIRFSLEGNVVDNGFSPLPTGSNSTDSGYTTENVSERDFLRTEGDPAAAGYTIKEALALTRSVIPSQRALALHLLASVLDKAIHNICQNQAGHNVKGDPSSTVDWDAIWAYALGPEPELALSLRMSLDDNHNSVVLASARVTQCVLSCDINESYFDISEKLTDYPMDINTAPVFRSRPEINDGFLLGGFWKYNAKPSNILHFLEEDVVDNAEGEQTIQDDMVVAGQDFVAGLVRMGILSRICYLLESDPSPALEECLISILVAVARHSPTCTNAIMKCERLLQTVVDRFTTKEPLETHPSKIKTVTLLKVLARLEKKNCIDFITYGVFQRTTWHLYQYKSSLDQWIKLGSDNRKLSSALIIEQLRFWKVCIQYGYCISNFSDLFPSLCLWLSVPTIEKLIEDNVLSEFAALTEEVFLVLGAMGRKLPNFYSSTHSQDQMFDVGDEETESWSWAHVGPMVDFALKWLALLNNHYEYEIFEGPLLRVISAVLLMLSVVLEVIQKDANSFPEVNLPRLPEFVPKIGLEMQKIARLRFIGANDSEHRNDPSRSSSFIQRLCLLRQQSDCKLAIASSSCLAGLVKVMASIDELIELAKSRVCAPSSASQSRLEEEVILAGGVVKFSMPGFSSALNTFMKLASSEWKSMQSVEVFGRGGPAPGVGVGWGAVGGGFWSKNLLLARADAELLIPLLEIFQTKLSSTEEMTLTVERIVSAFSVCLILGPSDFILMEKALDHLFQVPLLQFCHQCVHHFTSLNDNFKPFSWAYKYEDFQLFGETLASHFKNRWLSPKEKKKKTVKSETKRGLEMIPEESETMNGTNLSLTVKWAHQRLPLPSHWYLSPISYSYTKDQEGNDDFFEVAKAGLFFIMGIEVMTSFIPTGIQFPIRSVPLTWKLHCLSVSLLSGMKLLEEEKTRDVFRTLQGIYGKLLDESLPSIKEDLILDERNTSLAENGKKISVEFLRFQSEIHDSYSTFVENLVDQFSSVSYGDEIYGRQISVYLHRCVEAPVRLATWFNLSNARVLELLPPLEYCIGKAEGYLEPTEDEESILEAYVKSWVSGALDRAKTRGSMAYTLVLHHLTSFLFSVATDGRFSLRNKLVTSLLRDYIRNQKHESMMHDLIRYQNNGEKSDSSIMSAEVEQRFKLLAEACGVNSSLLRDLEKLRLSFQSNKVCNQAN